MCSAKIRSGRSSSRSRPRWEMRDEPSAERRAMRAHIDRLLRRLGAPGVLGIGVLLACAGFYVTALAPLEQETAAQRLALERLKSRAPYQPVSSGGRADELRRFYNLFPPAASLTDELERLDRLARGSGLELA